MSTIQTLNKNQLSDYLSSADGIHEMFRMLGYDVFDPEPFSAEDLDLNENDAPYVKQVYMLTDPDFGHTIWLYEVTDARMVRLRGLAHDAMQRGGGHLLLVTTDYKEVIVAHPYFINDKVTKSATRVNRLKIITNDPTRHDVDTINALHVHKRSANDLWIAQQEAFNVTRVTKKFYEEYRTHFAHLKEVIVQYNRHIPEFVNSDQTGELHAFAQRLLGRLMFLYFLQRKGWLGGQTDFLTRRYIETMRNHAGGIEDDNSYYYRDVLDPLFFETLNKRREEDWTRWKGLKIPYLNGGLFDRKRDPEGLITLPDALFDPNSDEGLLAFFNRYNFTIGDDTPLEQDVAVDPEMLGKVFENMLEEGDRGQSGSFYTPRTIVSYMCQEALAGYLEESANIPREETRKHFDPDQLVNFTLDEALRVRKALNTLTVLDPAVGSGSFLIGMMNELITIQRAASAALSEHVTPARVGGWKEQIIRDTLYGVDIKPEAIEIAQLRLWLSLVVNLTMEDAKPLPNLDYKLMAGDSLIETIDGEPVLGETAEQMLQETAKPRQQSLFESVTDKEQAKLEDLRHEYFSASPERRVDLRDNIQFQETRIIRTSLTEKRDLLQERITRLTKKQEAAGGIWGRNDGKEYQDLLEKQGKLDQYLNDLERDDVALPFFLYRLHFNDVFANKGGFDIVVANPPYVRGDKLGDIRFELESSYMTVFAKSADLYVYFFVRAFDLLRKNGELAFITSNKFKHSGYAKKLRSYLAEKQINCLIDFGELPIFKEAATDPIILIGNNKLSEQMPLFLQVHTWYGDDSDLKSMVENDSFQLPFKAIQQSDWLLTAKQNLDIISRIDVISESLLEYSGDSIYRGLVTGFNEAFTVDRQVRDELISNNANNSYLIKQLIVGDNIRKWHIESEDKYLIVTPVGVSIEQYPEIYDYLEKWQSKLESRWDKGNHWWEYRSCTYYHQFEKPKILIPDIAKESRFTMDYTNSYLTNSAYFIPLEDYYLLGVLNSHTLWFYATITLASLGDATKGGRLRFFTQFVKDLPIPDVPDDLRQQIADLAQQCLDMAKDDPSALPALEARLNQLVYQAYGLDEDDIAVIESHLEGK